MSVGLRIHVEPLPQGMWADENRAEAFQEAYRRCQPELVALCRRLLCGRGDPESVAQEAFVRAWRSIDSFTGARPFWPWVATIARRLCIDQRRRIGRETAKLHAEATMCEGQAAAGPDELLENDEEYRSALLALKRLKPAEQRVITLREVNGWSYDEIAQFEGVSVESVRGSLKRARVRLRESYAKVAAGVPAALGIGPLRRVRIRFGQFAAKHPAIGLHSPLPALVATDAFIGVVALVVGATAVGVAMDPVAIRAGEGSGITAAASAIAAQADGAGRSDGPASDASGRTGVVSSPDGAAAAEDGHGDVPGLAALPLPSDGGDSPEKVTFTTVTPSPSYSSDGTLFASGNVTEGCTYVVCPALFRSTDRGRSWQRLAAAGFQGGDVLLPGAYPADARIFSAGPTGLLVSGDQGHSFVGAAVITGPAAISPGFSGGDPRILFGATPGWEYRDDIQATKPGGVVLPSTSLSGTVAFAPTYPDDGRILIGGTTVSGASRNASAVFLCEEGVCDSAATLPGYIGPASLAVSPAYHLDNTVVAWRASGLFGSGDGGRSFRKLELPRAGDVIDVAFDGGAVLVLLAPAEGTGPSSLLRTTDLGGSWQDVDSGPGAAPRLSAIDVLPDRRILAARAAEAGGGILCSQDGGTTWFERCR